MAELASVPAHTLRKLPDPVDFTTAAAFGSSYQTAWVGLVELGQLREGQTVLVHGATGGVGLAAVDLSHALGGRVIATSGSTTKRGKLEALHRPLAVMDTQGRFRDQVRELTDGTLCDLVYDPVGGDTFDESTRCVAFGGKLLTVGFASGRIPTVPVNIPLIKGFSVVGVRAGEFGRRFPEKLGSIRDSLFALLTQGRLTPHIDRVLPLDQWRTGFEAMMNRDVFGKIIFVP